MSSRAAGTVARTATQISQMPKAADALANGRITAEHAATLADAAEKTSAEQVDESLVTTASSVPADVLEKRSRRWVDEQRTNQELENEQAELRRRRSARHFTRRDKMGVWVLELDPIADKAVASAIGDLNSAMFRDDHADATSAVTRTPEQRLADVMVQLLTETAGGGSGRHPKHQLAAVIDSSRFSDGPTGAANLIDGQALPQSVLERMACDASITPMIFGSDGRPLWVGRDYRTATIAQWKALIVRDRGCVGCGAAPSRCEAHHVVAWLANGPTDIDNLVLLCSRCHHDVHDRGMEVVRGPTGFALQPRAPSLADPGEAPSGQSRDFGLFA